MPTLDIIERQRERDRDRVRPTAPGNFITVIKAGTVLALVLAPTPDAYVKYRLYKAPYPKAYGYIDNPPIQPQFVALGPVTSSENVVPADLPIITEVPPGLINPINPPTPTPIIIPQPITQQSGGQGITPTIAAPFIPGDASTVKTATTPKQITTGSIKIKQLMLRALPTNAGDIWVNFRQSVAINDGFLLAKGEGRVINIDDLSKIYFLGANATDRLEFTYFV